MTFLFSRQVIIGIAVLGGIASIAAMVLRARRTGDAVLITRLNRAAYALMGISVVLFIIKGFAYP